MKIFFKLLIAFCIVSLLAAKSFSQTSDKNRIEVVFTHKMKNDDLVKIKETLLKKNIQLEFVRTRFDGSGYLVALAFKVNCNDGFKGDASNPDLTRYKKRFGFYREYKKNVKSPFGVGFI